MLRLEVGREKDAQTAYLNRSQAGQADNMQNSGTSKDIVLMYMYVCMLVLKCTYLPIHFMRMYLNLSNRVHAYLFWGSYNVSNTFYICLMRK